MSYAKLVNFGPSVEKSPNNNPLTYCMTTDLNNSFMHTAGERRGPYSKSCQMFMSDYCAKDWNGICEIASRNTNNQYPNTAAPWSCDKVGQGACLGAGIGNQFSQGDLLVRNTAMKKYLSAMSANCNLKFEPFDPMNPTSPMISYFESDCNYRSACTPVYEVDEKTIDDDPVMNRLLEKPSLGMDILTNIYNNASRNGKLDSLQGTKLHRFFGSNVFQTFATVSKNRALSQVAGPNFNLN